MQACLQACIACARARGSRTARVRLERVRARARASARRRAGRARTRSVCSARRAPGNRDTIVGIREDHPKMTSPQSQLEISSNGANESHMPPDTPSILHLINSSHFVCVFSLPYFPLTDTDSELNLRSHWVGRSHCEEIRCHYIPKNHPLLVEIKGQ